ncbi:MAG: class I SAM-dependent methyltransferase [Candidatus Hydrogenedentales bacterium]|jgi:methionine biosynthesis protein MetW
MKKRPDFARGTVSSCTLSDSYRIDYEPDRHGDEFGYFEWVRTDVLRIIPESASRVLSVGCGAAATEAALLSSGREVVGVELDARAAEVACERGIHVIQQNAASAVPQLAGEKFDCLLFLDILEHMQEPEQVIRNFTPLLAAGGAMIISVPNFRHYSVAVELFLKGDFPYTHAGIFDRTHVQITTRKRVERWVRDAGFIIPKAVYVMYRRRERILSALSCGLLREFLAAQVLVLGTKVDS